jgi:SNF2 family DNA or RNA helicase
MAEGYSFRLRNEPDLTTKLKAFPYQEEAAEFVAGLEYAAIFHEQGLGKTKIAIDVITHWLKSGQIDTVLVLTKKGLVANWIREFRLHSHLVPLVISDNATKNYYAFTTPARLIVGHFEVAKKEERRLKAWLSSRKVAVFLDEAVRIKNPDAEVTKVLHRLAPLFKKRVIMTGTPVANRPFDIWSQIFFLDRGAALGEKFSTFKRGTDFSEDYHHDAGEFQNFQRRLDDVNRRIAKFTVRETKDGGRIVLPDKEIVRLETDWELSQFELYRQVKDELRLVLMRDGTLIDESQELILKRLLRLIQIASNPILVDERYSKEPGKFPALYDLIVDITGKGEKAIIWTSFNENSEWLTSRLSAFGSLTLNGQVPIEKRNAVVNWFMDNDEDRVLVATPGAAKEGLTLTVANHVIFFDRTYSLDDYLQAQDRIHRISQSRTCYVYNMIMRDSVDEWVDSLLEEKRLAARLTQGDIDQETYAAQASLSFYEILRRIID